MAERVSKSRAKQLQLARAARVAGEAFGCHDDRVRADGPGAPALVWIGSLASALIGATAAAALYLGS